MMHKVPSRLRERQDELQQMAPLSAATQSIAYNDEHWRRRFAADEDLDFLFQQHPRTLSRGDLAKWSQRACQERSERTLRRLFLGSMVWGYGSAGYGAYRTQQMTAFSGLGDTLRAASHLIEAGEIGAAYQQFRVPMCGPSFLSKYFYIVGLGANATPLPLILDSVVAYSLEAWLGLEINCFAHVFRKKNTKKNNAIVSLGRFSAGYECYVHTLNQWAKELGCRPDSIELLLFRQGRAGQ